jgi:hypothetical protein
MSTKWQNVPRDPIADDEELENMYQRAAIKKPSSAAGSTKVAANSVEIEQQRKLPLPSYRPSRAGKLACIALFALSLSAMKPANRLHFPPVTSAGMAQPN